MPHMSSMHTDGNKSIRDLLDWLSLAFGFQVKFLTSMYMVHWFQMEVIQCYFLPHVSFIYVHVIMFDNRI